MLEINQTRKALCIPHLDLYAFAVLASDYAQRAFACTCMGFGDLA